MKKDIFAILESGNPLMTQALEATNRYYEAQHAQLPANEVDRLRMEAEQLFQAVNEFQQRMLGRRSDTLH
ncbi:hypothetical protein ACIP01_22035 [Pseudomonas monteilii]|uniref:hypothetical protein n=1 Tax=Pseudomonas monteilii TaxID=76759 RepID=UPI003808E75C